MYQRLHPTPSNGVALPRALSLLLLAAGLGLAIWAPLAGAPASPPPLLGQPGVISTFDPRLQQLERDIAARRAGQFTLTISQADIDAELAAQFGRLSHPPVGAAYLRPGPDVLYAGGLLTIGPSTIPASIELSIGAAACQPVVTVRALTIGADPTPGWLRERAEALVRSQLDAIVARELGFCLEQVSLREGTLIVAGRVEGQP